MPASQAGHCFTVATLAHVAEILALVGWTGFSCPTRALE